MNAGRERRGAKRFALSVDVKFLLRGTEEGAGRLLDISEKGLALFSDINAVEGDPIVVYPLGLGRIEGEVVRCFEGGLGVSFTLSDAQKETILERIAAALEGKSYMRLVEKRSDLRIRYNIETTAQLDNIEPPIICTIVDMSRSGCLLHAAKKPGLGEEVIIGALRGRVSRHVDDGFAIEFTGSATNPDPDKVGNAA